MLAWVAWQSWAVPQASQPAGFLTMKPSWLQIDYMSEDDARWIFQQLIVAVDYCHRLGIANRDIKVLCLHAATWRACMLLFTSSGHGWTRSATEAECRVADCSACRHHLLHAQVMLSTLVYCSLSRVQRC